ncbi:hypothetical protein [Herbaspirillum sp. YR522]|uniref:hypothetical protein n=1 Tax=Herbaspirillum sp. YR522 TaxID=1144342 RepID=UPI00026F6538|nr:hypothetical protein [Herbaspirillum sp. YR522]EJN03582.1 hypothetical protein PMI40_02685 [Herbaspirillum sp. YR522]
MPQIGLNPHALDQFDIASLARQLSSPPSAPAPSGLQENSHLPAPLAGQGGSRHPLQASPLFTLLPRELRNQITAYLDTAAKLDFKLTCRQAYAEGVELHFDATITSGDKLTRALTFFNEGQGRLDSMRIEAKGTPDNYQRSLAILGQRLSRVQVDLPLETPALTNLVTVELDQLRQLHGPGFKSLKSLDLVGCRFRDQGHDVPQQAVAILGGLALERVRLVNNDWLTMAHLDQLYQAGTRSFSLVGNPRLTQQDLEQFAARDGVDLDLAADASELADRQANTRTGEFDRAYADPDRRLGMQFSAQGRATAMSLI